MFHEDTPTVRVNHPYNSARFMTINKSDFDESKHTLWRDPFGKLPPDDNTEKVCIPIPSDWLEMKWFAMRSLAANFAPAPANKAAAVSIIEAELARRG